MFVAAAELFVAAPVRKRFLSGSNTSRSSSSNCFAKAMLSHMASQPKYFLEFASDHYEEQPPIDIVEQGNNEVQAPIDIVERTISKRHTKIGKGLVN